MAISNFFTINGREYEWADICLNVGGVEIKGFRGISYKETQDKEVLYAKGNTPYAIQHGKKTFGGTLTFTQSELIALQAVAATKSILDIQTDIVISYVPADSLVIVTDIIKGAEFTDLEKKMKQGDKNMEVDLPFIALDIING